MQTIFTKKAYVVPSVKKDTNIAATIDPSLLTVDFSKIIYSLQCTDKTVDFDHPEYEHIAKHCHQHLDLDYPDIATLRQLVHNVYTILSDPSLDFNYKLMIAVKINEDLSGCIEGFQIRLNQICNMHFSPQNLDDLLFRIRNALVNQTARQHYGVQLGLHVHIENHFFEIASKHFGVMVLIQADSYSSGFSDESVYETLEQTFNQEYSFWGGIKLLIEEMKAVLNTFQYRGRQRPGSALYTISEMERFKEWISQIIHSVANVSMDNFCELHPETADILDINWNTIHQEMFNHLCLNGYIDVSACELSFIQYMLKDYSTSALDKSLDALEHQLFACHTHFNSNDLIHCLDLFFYWTNDKKQQLVDVYTRVKRLGAVAHSSDEPLSLTDPTHLAEPLHLAAPLRPAACPREPQLLNKATNDGFGLDRFESSQQSLNTTEIDIEKQTLYATVLNQLKNEHVDLLPIVYNEAFFKKFRPISIAIQQQAFTKLIFLFEKLQLLSSRQQADILCLCNLETGNSHLSELFLYLPDRASIVLNVINRYDKKVIAQNWRHQNKKGFNALSIITLYHPQCLPFALDNILKQLDDELVDKIIRYTLLSNIDILAFMRQYAPNQTIPIFSRCKRKTVSLCLDFLVNQDQNALNALNVRESEQPEKQVDFLLQLIKYRLYSPHRIFLSLKKFAPQHASLFLHYVKMLNIDTHVYVITDLLQKNYPWVDDSEALKYFFYVLQKSAINLSILDYYHLSLLLIRTYPDEFLTLFNQLNLDEVDELFQFFSGSDHEKNNIFMQAVEFSPELTKAFREYFDKYFLLDQTFILLSQTRGDGFNALMISVDCSPLSIPHLKKMILTLSVKQQQELLTYQTKNGQTAFDIALNRSPMAINLFINLLKSLPPSVQKAVIEQQSSVLDLERDPRLCSYREYLFSQKKRDRPTFFQETHHASVAACSVFNDTDEHKSKKARTNQDDTVEHSQCAPN